MKRAKGLKVSDLCFGKGREVTLRDVVHFHCTCRLSKGDVVFTTKDNSPWQIRVGARDSFVALDQGLLGMKVGGLRRVKVSPHLTYYDRKCYPQLPDNAVLTYDLQLIAIPTHWDNTLFIRESPNYSQATKSLESRYRSLKPSSELGSEFQRVQAELFRRAEAERLQCLAGKPAILNSIGPKLRNLNQPGSLSAEDCWSDVDPSSESFMRSLTKPAVLLQAFIAGTISAVACYPRLVNWTQREDAVWFLVAVIGWAAFVMWAAVFAWHQRHGQREVFPQRVPTHLWLITLALGVTGAVVSFHFGDPTLQQLAPTDFPRNPGQWLEHVLFNLALEQLFLCFAPFAFFVRLLPSAKAAAIGVVLFGLLVCTLKLQSLSAALSWEVALVLVLFRAIHSTVTVWLYLRGGVWLVWLFALLLQSRHWFAFG